MLLPFLVIPAILRPPAVLYPTTHHATIAPAIPMFWPGTKWARFLPSLLLHYSLLTTSPLSLEEDSPGLLWEVGPPCLPLLFSMLWVAAPILCVSHSCCHYTNLLLGLPSLYYLSIFILVVISFLPVPDAFYGLLQHSFLLVPVAPTACGCAGVLQPHAHSAALQLAHLLAYLGSVPATSCSPTPYHLLLQATCHSDHALPGTSTAIPSLPALWDAWLQHLHLPAAILLNSCWAFYIYLPFSCWPWTVCNCNLQD